MKTRKLTFIAMLITLSLVLFLVERLLPVPQGIPGIKLGLANIVTIIALFTLSFSEVCLLVFVRVFLASAFGGGFTSFWFSLTGGLLSLAVMYILSIKKAGFMSLPAISVAGALTHNLGQLLVAAFYVSTPSILYYLPFLSLSAIITGFAIGVAAKSLLEYLLHNGQIEFKQALIRILSKT